MATINSESVNWKDLACKAMRTRAGFERLLAALDPAIVNISHQHCPNDPESAAQEARLKLFDFVYQQKRVNLSLPSNTIGTFLRCACRNWIINEHDRVARNGMQGRGPSEKGSTHARPTIVPLEHYAALSRATVDESKPLPFPLQLYAEYYAHHGTLNGAAAWCEERYGFCRLKVDAEFRRVVATMRK